MHSPKARLSLLNNFQWNEQKFHLFTKNEKFWDLNERRGDFEQIERREIRSEQAHFCRTALIQNLMWNSNPCAFISDSNVLIRHFKDNFWCMRQSEKFAWRVKSVPHNRNEGSIQFFSFLDRFSKKKPQTLWLVSYDADWKCDAFVRCLGIH